MTETFGLVETHAQSLNSTFSTSHLPTHLHLRLSALASWELLVAIGSCLSSSSGGSTSICSKRALLALVYLFARAGPPCGGLALDSLPIARWGSVRDSLHHPESRGLLSSCSSSSHESTHSSMAITRTPRSFTLGAMASRLLCIVACILRSILSMALMSHVSSKRLLALDVGCSSVAHSLPLTEGCPVSGSLAFSLGVRDSSLNIVEQYSHCTVLSMPLPWDMAVISASSIAGRRVSGTTHGVPASHHSLHGEDPHAIQLHHWNCGFVTPRVPVGRRRRPVS